MPAAHAAHARETRGVFNVPAAHCVPFNKKQCSRAHGRITRMQINCAPAETIYSSILRLISRHHGGCVEARGLMPKYSLSHTHTRTRTRAYEDTRYVFHGAKKCGDKDDESGGSGVSWIYMTFSARLTTSWVYLLRIGCSINLINRKSGE